MYQPPNEPTAPLPSLIAPPPPPVNPPRKKMRRGCFISLIIAACLLVAIIALAAYGSTLPQAPTAAATATSVPTQQTSHPTATRQPTSAPKPTAIAKITAAQKQQVSAILTKNIQHYQQLLAQGKSVLGTTQYADANAGLAAFNDPSSAASRFRDWRQSSNAERDVSYINAFNQADANYNADNEPAAISMWRDDMSTMQSDLANWVTTAVSWQIRDKTDADLSAAESQFNQDIKQVQSDLANTLASS